MTIEGDVISAASNAVVIGTHWSVTLTSWDTTASFAVVTLNGLVLSATESTGSDIIINGAILTPGGPDASLYAVDVSAASDGLVVGRSTTIALAAPGSRAASTTTGSSLGSSTPQATTGSAQPTSDLPQSTSPSLSQPASSATTSNTSNSGGAIGVALDAWLAAFFILGLGIVVCIM